MPSQSSQGRWRHELQGSPHSRLLGLVLLLFVFSLFLRIQLLCTKDKQSLFQLSTACPGLGCVSEAESPPDLRGGYAALRRSNVCDTTCVRAYSHTYACTNDIHPVNVFSSTR